MKTNFQKIGLLALFAWLLSASGAQAQTGMDIVQRFPFGTKLSTISDSVEAFYKDRDKGRGSGYKQWKRWEHWAGLHLDERGGITNAAARTFAAWQDEQSNERGNGQPMNGQWYSSGPDTVALGAGWNTGLGRVNCFAFHPTNGSVFAGAAGGGLWKGTPNGSGGFTWAYLTKGVPVPGVSGVVVHPSNPNTIFMLTGDGDSADSYCIGVLKSTDGGANWSQTGLQFAVPDSVLPFKLAMYPGKPDTMFAATNEGVYRTFDGGTTWQIILNQYVTDFEFKPGTPTRMYVATVNSTNTSWTADIRYTTNCLLAAPVFNVSTIANYPLTASGNQAGRRISLDVTNANAAHVYALIGQANNWLPANQFGGYFRSTDSGVNFARRANTPNILSNAAGGNATDTQAGYDLALWVSDSSTNLAVTGGVNLWRTTNGTVFNQISHWNLNSLGGLPYAHADIHAIEYNPVDKRLYVGCDGGLFASANYGATWADVTGRMSITQFYSVDVDDDNTSNLLGGAQDNGGFLKTAGNLWLNFVGADCANAFFEGANGNIIYALGQNGNLRLSTNGGTSLVGGGAGTTFNPVNGRFISPMIPDPNNAQGIYLGLTNNVYRGTRAGNNINFVNLGGTGESKLAAGATRLYAATDDTLQRMSIATGTWTFGLKNGTNGWTTTNRISGLAINPDNDSEIWVTLSGYNAAEKVFRSTNAGASWSNMTGALPNTAVLSIAFADNNGSPGGAVYIGTDLGVYYRDNTTGGWVPFINGLPSGGAVMDLEIHPSSGRVYAATFGHGIWYSALYDDCPVAILLDDPLTGYFYQQASQSINATSVISGGYGTEVRFKAGDYIDLEPGFRTVGDSYFEARTGPCSTGIPPAQANGQGN